MHCNTCPSITSSCHSRVHPYPARRLHTHLLDRIHHPPIATCLPCLVQCQHFLEHTLRPVLYHIHPGSHSSSYYDIRFRQKIKLKLLTRLSVVDVGQFELELATPTAPSDGIAIQGSIPTIGSCPESDQSIPMVDLL
jgi:hypothetical protein